jgi:hypothetical protein
VFTPGHQPVKQKREEAICINAGYDELRLLLCWTVLIQYKLRRFITLCSYHERLNPNNITGRKTRLVSVASTRVKDVSHPNAWVPPKPLKQKMTNPAINTREV